MTGMEILVFLWIVANLILSGLIATVWIYVQMDDNLNLIDILIDDRLGEIEAKLNSPIRYRFMKCLGIILVPFPILINYLYKRHILNNCNIMEYIQKRYSDLEEKDD